MVRDISPAFPSYYGKRYLPCIPLILCSLFLESPFTPSLKPAFFLLGSTPLTGEGDGLPGLVIDVYGHVAVIKLDGAGASAFYDANASGWIFSAGILTL